MFEFSSPDFLFLHEYFFVLIIKDYYQSQIAVVLPFSRICQNYELAEVHPSKDLIRGPWPKWSSWLLKQQNKCVILAKRFGESCVS